MKKINNSKVFIEIEYKDGTNFTFDVISHAENANDYQGEIMMITRGTLMATLGTRATAYNEEGFPICSYVK